MPDLIRIAVGVPAYGGHVVAEHVKMWSEFGFILANSPQRFQLAMFGHVDINGVDNARNHLLQAATEARASWLLMIDADTWVEAYGKGPDEIDAGFQLLRMISEADRADAAIVAAPVMRRFADRDKREVMAYRFKKNAIDDIDKVGEDIEKIVPINDEELLSGPTFIEVDAVATAVFAVNLSKVGFAKFEFTNTLSEDLEFCRQIEMAGGKVLVDRRVKAGHKSRPFSLYVKEF